MLKQSIRRLALRLTILVVMVGALAWPSSGSSQLECFFTFDPDTGQCVYICCAGSNCNASSCE